MADVLPSLLPATAEAVDQLLTDESGLHELSEEYFTRFASETQSVISVRVVGRVVADIHRELSLRVPDEEALYRAMMQHSCDGTFSMDHDAFVAFIEEVLLQCIQGRPLTKEGAGTSFAAMESETGETQLPTSVGLVTVNAHTLSGASASIEIQDSEMLDVLQQKVEEELGVPPMLQRLLLGTSILEQGRPLFEQRVSKDATITVLRCKPQATLLRIRRVNLGDDIRTPPAQPEKQGKILSVTLMKETKHQAQLRRMGATEKKKVTRSHSTGSIVPSKSVREVSRSRRVVSDVRIRRVNLGRL